MKKQTLILAAGTAVAGMAAGIYVREKKKAKEEDRSLSGMFIEDSIMMLPSPDRRKPALYKQCMKKSGEKYVLPDIARKFGCTEYDGFEDTFLVEPEKKSGRDLVIFYLHGGGYWVDPTPMHFRFFRKISDLLGEDIIFPVYPKAPAHHAKEVHKMVKDRYRYLIEEKKIPSGHIIFMGDSAGGGLALALMESLRDERMPLPGLAFLISPWLDVTNSNPEMKYLQPYDAVLEIDRFAFQGKEYAGSDEPTEPFISPIYGRLNDLPRTVVFSGTHEIIYADVLALRRKTDIDALDFVFRIFENQMHCFVCLPIPEGKEACEMIEAEVGKKYGTTKE